MARTTSEFPWKRNLIVLWFAQVVTTLGFSFTFPFFPIFFTDLGVEEVERAEDKGSIDSIERRAASHDLQVQGTSQTLQ